MKKNAFQTIPLLLAECKRKFSKKPAFELTSGKKISYDDMMWDVSRTTQLLRTLGVTKSSKVALFTDNSPQTVETLLAITRMGTAAIPLSYDYTQKQIAEILDTEQPAALFIQKDKMSILPESANMTILEMADNRVLKSVSRNACSIPSEILEDDIAAIWYQVSADGKMKRRTFTQKEIASAVCSAKAIKPNKAKKVNKPNALTRSLDSMFAYTRTYFVPMVNGICVHCHDLISSISNKKTQAKGR